METLDLIIIFGGTSFAFLAVLGWKIARAARRRKLFTQPFPEKWKKYVENNVSIYNSLPSHFKKELLGHINVFLGEKHFEGCGGQEITDEIKVTVAAQACLLLLNKKTEYFSKLASILIYPEAYVANGPSRMGNQTINDHSARLGESWMRGVVVLAWQHVKNGGSNTHDGNNVVLHEFAHQLDQETGAANGAPIMQGINPKEWSKIFQHDFEELQDEVEHGHRDVIDAYGATNPAEFFAVATETFFEKPSQLKEVHPDLYRELQIFYKVNPLEWHSQS